jgi:spermidine synthase
MFLLTGLSGLWQEQGFERLLGTLLGASTPAASVVLAVYFGGLSLGNVAYARFLSAWRVHPLRAYLLLEGVVATWGLLLWGGFDHLTPLFVPLLAASAGHPVLLLAARGLVALCWMLPSTVAMGATFPAIVDVLEAWRVPSAGRVMGQFYAANLAGAALGAVLGPWLVLPELGLDGALFSAAAVDLVVILWGLWLPRQRRRAAGGLPRAAGGAPAGTGVVLLVALGSGFLFFSLEVLWTHLISAVLGNSVYSFAAMLAVVLCSLALGSALGSALTPQRRMLSSTWPAAWLLLGVVMLVVTCGGWPATPEVLAAQGGRALSFEQGEWLKWRRAAFLIAPAAIPLGMVYPLLFRMAAFQGGARARVTGRAGALNAVGCVVGALACGWVFIPWLGSELTLRTLVCMGAAMAAALALQSPGRAGLGLAAAAALTGLASMAMPRWDTLQLTSGKHVYLDASSPSDHGTLVFFEEDASGMTTVVDVPVPGRTPPTVRYLFTNGKFQGNDGDETEAQVGLGLAPMVFCNQAEAALVVGLGTGHTAHVVRVMGFERVDVAEISPAMVHAARKFSTLNANLLDAPNVRVAMEDGRNHLLLAPTRYNLVTVELASVWFSGATDLYSREFYRLVRSRLVKGGVFQQWIQMHHLGLDELLSVVGTLQSVFPHVSFWVIGGQGLMVATDGEQAITPWFLQALAAHAPGLGWPATEVETRLQTLWASQLLAPDAVKRVVESVKPVLNTDRNRYLEYASPRFNYDPHDTYSESLVALARAATFPPPVFAEHAEGPLRDAVSSVTMDHRLRALGLTVAH